MSIEERITALEAEIERLRARDRPPTGRGPRAAYDPTAQMSMPAEALREMARVDVGALVADFRRGPAAPSSVIPSRPSAAGERPSVGVNGWIGERPIGPPAGVAICDQMLDAQDALDRRQRERERG